MNDKPAPKPERNRWATTLNSWLPRVALFMAGAHLGIPGLASVAGSALRNAGEFAHETLGIVLQPGDDPQEATDNLYQQLGAHGIEPTACWYDESCGRLQFEVPADMAADAGLILGDTFDMVADGLTAAGDVAADAAGSVMGFLDGVI